MEVKPIKDVVEDLKVIFNAVEHIGPCMLNPVKNNFLIHKEFLEREEVIAKLLEYFKDKVIENGYLEVSSITLIYTSFKVKEGKPE